MRVVAFIGGLILAAPAGIIVATNMWQSELNRKALAWGGNGITQPAYTFMPPWTAFEVGVLACLAIGGLLLVCAANSDQ